MTCAVVGMVARPQIRRPLALAVTLAILLASRPTLAQQPEKRRTEPTDTLNPTVVTKRLIRGIAARKWPIERFVDRSRGVVFIAYVSDGEPQKTARRLCGEALTRALAALSRDLSWTFRADPNPDIFSCKNGAMPKCAAGWAGEFVLAKELWFAPKGSDGLFLDTVITRNTAYRNEKAERRFVSRHRKRLANTRCKSPPP